MTDNASATVVIVGAGHATGEFATALRHDGFKGRIVAFGDEPYLPYQRPPLSKTYLAGECTLDSLYVRPRTTYREAQIEFHLNVRVAQIDRQQKQVVLADGQRVQLHPSGPQHWRSRKTAGDTGG